MLYFSLSLKNRLKQPSLQFSFLYFDLVVLEGSTFTRIFITFWNNTLSSRSRETPPVDDTDSLYTCTKIVTDNSTGLCYLLSKTFW